MCGRWQDFGRIDRPTPNQTRRPRPSRHAIAAAAQLIQHARKQPASGTARQQLVRNLAVVNASTVFEQVYIWSLQKMMPGLLTKNIKTDHDTALLVHYDNIDR